MARMLVIYRTPKNVEAFDRHYFEIHVPLAKKIPGLRKYEVSDGPIATPHTLESSHSPFLSQPAALSRILIDIGVRSLAEKSAEAAWVPIHEHG